MQRILSTAICTLLIQMGQAQAQTNSKLNLEHATVFLSCALLESTATLNLKQGENEVTFTNVANNVNTGSIIINATSGVAVASSSYDNSCTQPTSGPNPMIAKLQDSINMVNDKKPPINNKISSIDDQLKLLATDITDNGDDKPVPGAEEISKMMDLIARKKEVLLNEKNKQLALLRKMDTRITYCNNRIREEQTRNVLPGGDLVVKFYAREATTSKITVKYIVANAGWSPAYDIWADDVNSPIKLYYKANIHQNTGINWDKVRLTLSTGNPQEGMQPPVINPWYMSLSAPPPPPAREVVTAYNRPLVDKYKNNVSLTSKEIMQLPSTESMDLEAVTPNAYANERGSTVLIDGARTQVEEMATMTNYVAVDNTGVNTTFDIELPYSIPNDGQQHYVAVKAYNVPAHYQYFSVPRMDRDAFLQAEITKWNELSLLPGPTNIFYEGTYIGQGDIDPRTLKDTMFISLGRDKKIVIKKEQDSKMHSVRKTGSSEEEAYGFNITVRNTRKDSITVLIQDQMPVSNDKDLLITDVNMGTADYESATGIMSWTINLKANESKKLTFGYTIKHPKDRQIIGMK